MARSVDAAGTSPAARAGADGAEVSEDGDPTLLYLVGRVDRVVRREIGAVLKVHGLSVNQYTTLSVLAHRSGLSNAQLARRALVSPQSMNEVLLALEQRQLVQRRAHPEHGRILQARLTPRGRALLTRCDAEVHEVESRMVDGLSADDRQALRRMLLRGIRALQGGLGE